MAMVLAIAVFPVSSDPSQVLRLGLGTIRLGEITGSFGEQDSTWTDFILIIDVGPGHSPD